LAFVALAQSSAAFVPQAYSLNLVDPATGELTGQVPGSFALEKTARWDSLNRDDGKGTDRSLQGGLSYNVEGNTLNAFFQQFTWATGTTQAQFASAFQSAVAAMSYCSVTMVKTTEPVVLDIGVAGNRLEGNEIDVFGNPITGSALGNTAIFGVDANVRLTSGFGAPNLFPSTRIYGADIVIDTSNNGTPWTLDKWKHVLMHELGHALGLSEAEDKYFWDNDDTINNPMVINEFADVRMGLENRGWKDLQDVTGILMCSDCGPAGLIGPQPDDFGGLKFLYPCKSRTVPVVSWPGLVAIVLILLVSAGVVGRAAAPARTGGPGRLPNA
jgi:hypothetical protein